MHLIDNGSIKDRTAFEFSKDWYKVAENQYAHYNADVCHDIGSFGKFFPAVLANPTHFILP